ncbi:hypothetical protein [Mangrovicella endophytica]|uniref:hypothetical protein n=1 Tax=Mangrovicella endophytica TaxID=2066697 RepID=UPI000C9E629C|nr:hypothetical protein [Mangrovicella endophytica]
MSAIPIPRQEDVRYRESDIVLLQQSLQSARATPCRIPANLGDFLYSAGVMAGIASVFGPVLDPFLPLLSVTPLSAGIAWGVMNSTVDVASLKQMKDRYRGLNFIPSPDQEARIGIAFDVVALQQASGAQDIGISANVIFASHFRCQPDEPVLNSMYRDMVSFSILPTPGGMAGWRRNNRALLPPTTLKSTAYNFSTGWTVGGGFNGEIGASPTAGFEANGSYSFGVSAERTGADFETTRNTAGAAEMAAWTSTLQTVSDNGIPRNYSFSQPESIVAHTIFTKWLCSPPDTAKQDLDLAYFAGFTREAGAGPSTPLRFTYAATQRLMYAEVFGRWGAPGARVGGAAGILPALMTLGGELVIDLSARKAWVENETITFRTMPEAIDDVIRMSGR